MRNQQETLNDNISGVSQAWRPKTHPRLVAAQNRTATPSILLLCALLSFLIVPMNVKGVPPGNPAVNPDNGIYHDDPNSNPPYTNMPYNFVARETNT